MNNTEQADTARFSDQRTQQLAKENDQLKTSVVLLGSENERLKANEDRAKQGLLQNK